MNKAQVETEIIREARRVVDYMQVVESIQEALEQRWAVMAERNKPEPRQELVKLSGPGLELVKLSEKTSLMWLAEVWKVTEELSRLFDLLDEEADRDR